MNIREGVEGGLNGRTNLGLITECDESDSVI